jgi:hypothetical protein
MAETRYILEAQGPYVGITNQRSEAVGRRGIMRVWVSAGGGGDFFDPTEEQKRILQEHGSPVIVYPDGKVKTPVK